MANLNYKGSGCVVKNGRQMSHISEHLLFLCMFPELFLRKKTRACPGNWEVSMAEHTGMVTVSLTSSSLPILHP